MATQSEPNVSVMRDLIFAALIASTTLGAWVTVFTLLGDTSKLDTGFVTFLGGVLAISGLLFRQYMFKEVLDYLKSWDRMGNILRDLMQIGLKQGYAEDDHLKDLASQEIQAQRYSKYIKHELTFVPIVPIVLIFLYGCALLSDNSIAFREVCLFLMMLLVAYLALAAVSSTKLACAFPDLEKTITDLEELRRELETSQQG
ncbi:MAG TPA: hypothetical protein PKD36_13170 [Geobacter sulfurreducens]|nr:hypothetical protein [Geobacter sulfurreducens]